MPSPLNLRARLRALFGRGTVPKANSEEQDIQAFSDELTKVMHLLACSVRFAEDSACCYQLID